LADPPADAPLVRAEDLEVRYGRSADSAVSGVSFTLQAGEGLVVTGPQGAGKTSLLRGLLGLAPALGVAEVLGRPAGAPDALRHVGFAPAGRPWPARLTAREVLALVAALRGLPTPGDAADEAVERAGLTRPDDLAWALDAEECRRLALGLALAGDPSVLVLDEPWEFVETRDELERARERGAAILVGTEDPGGLPDLLGRTLALDAGGTPA
jgi:ABC-type multidrug transport system ATPase subunit